MIEYQKLKFLKQSSTSPFITFTITTKFKEKMFNIIYKNSTENKY